MLDRYNNNKPSTGTLYLTATHLIFVGPDCKKETWVSVKMKTNGQIHSGRRERILLNGKVVIGFNVIDFAILVLDFKTARS